MTRTPKVLTAALVALALGLLAGCGVSIRPLPPTVPTTPVVDVPPVDVPPVIVPPARVGRTGFVRVEGAAFADDQGAFNPLGFSLFWSLWAEKHDPDKLERNLAHLAANGADFVRIFTMVGTETWFDRTINSKDGDYWDVAARLFERLKRHGIRAEVTLFADAQVMMPDLQARRDWLHLWGQFLNARRDQVLLIEIANEHWQNGFADIALLREFGNFARSSLTDIPVALSAPGGGLVAEVYRDFGGVATMHYDRDIGLADGVHRPLRQTYGWSHEYSEKGSARLPRAVVNNEPRTAGSGNDSDHDPIHLGIAYATTFITNNSAFVAHLGAGVRGGGQWDVIRGRVSDFTAEDPALFAALAAMKKLLPAGLANWSRTAGHLHDYPWTGSTHEGDIMRAYGGQHGDRFVGALLDVKRPHPATARRAIDLQFIHPATGAVLHTFALTAGQNWTVPADLHDYLVLGTYR